MECQKRVPTQCKQYGKWLFFVVIGISCPVFPFSQCQNILNDSETTGVKKASLPWKKKRQGKSHLPVHCCPPHLLRTFCCINPCYQCRTLCSPPNTQNLRIPLPHPHHELLTNIFSVSFKISPHRKAVMARVPGQLFRRRFGGKKLHLFHITFLFTDTTLNIPMTPDNWSIVFSLIFGYRNEIWAVFFSLSHHLHSCTP